MAGKPGVYITTDEFLDNATSASKDVGMPAVRKVALPAATYYRARGSIGEVRPIAQAYIDKIIDALLRPAAEEEENPKPLKKEMQDQPITVTGKDYRDAEAKVNRVFLDNRWADGLPVVPPTDEAVKEMLAGTQRSPDEILGVVAPKKGQATVRKIAVNAVMAGARPEYLPVIIAAMEGFLDKNYDLTHVQASTGSFLPAIIVSGPIAKELNFNSGTGMLGHGWQANATVGRALRLCLLNLGQTWPGVNDMGLTGRASPYTFYTFGEDEDRNPWAPEHVKYGIKAEDSSVAVSTVGGQYRVLGGGAVAIWTAQGVLDDIVSSISSLGTLRPNEKHVVVFHPDCATELEKMGFKTIRSVQEWLYEHSRVPLTKLRQGVPQAVQRMIDDGRISPDRAPVFREALKDGGSLPMVQSPDDIHIFVAGGSPGYTLLFSYIGGSHQTRKISGATLTKSGR
jgi:hypothetical protein